MQPLKQIDKKKKFCANYLTEEGLKYKPDQLKVIMPSMVGNSGFLRAPKKEQHAWHCNCEPMYRHLKQKRLRASARMTSSIDSTVRNVTLQSVSE